MDKLTLKYVWGQERIPVVLRRTGKGQRLRVRLPFAETNRQWLQNGRRTSPVWIDGKKYWELPKAWFNDFVERALAKYGKVYVIQPYREQEKCSPACQNAIGHDGIALGAPIAASVLPRGYGERAMNRGFHRVGNSPRMSSERASSKPAGSSHRMLMQGMPPTQWHPLCKRGMDR